MAKWLDKYEQGGMVLKKKTKDNYGKKENANEGHSTAGPGWVGEGTTNRGFDYNGAWGGQFQNGGFLQPTSYKLPPAANEGAMSTEKATSIGGGPGEPAFLIPTFKYGKPLKDAEAEYRKTGEHLGGPFKTYQEAEKFGELRHQYVEQGRNIPSPYKWWDEMRDGGKLPEVTVYGHRDSGTKGYFDKLRKSAETAEDKGEDLSIAEYRALEQMHGRYGAPKVNVINVEETTPYYNPLNDTMNITEANPNLFLAELAHKEQANQRGRLGFIKDFVGNDLINTVKNIFSKGENPYESYSKNYKTKGTIENEAHDIIEPKLNYEFNNLVDEERFRFNPDKKRKEDDFARAAIEEYMKANNIKKKAMGGSLPGAVGFTYARVAGAAPSNGKYAKKTKASAQNGKEMSFYQQGLDFTPKTISKDGSVIKDDRGQWAHPGEVTEINSNDITMKGVDYPVLGISDTGDTKMMEPGKDYKFKGSKVTEYPKGGWLNKYK
jgi:hypothetical protein